MKEGADEAGEVCYLTMMGSLVLQSYGYLCVIGLSFNRALCSRRTAKVIKINNKKMRQERKQPEEKERN